MIILKFGIVGLLGATSNIIVFEIARIFLNIFMSSLLSFLVAVTQNYFMNHIFTFKQNKKPNMIQYIKYFGSSFSGFIINVIVLYFLKDFSPTLGQILGILCGAILNFLISKFIVFK